MPQGVGSRRRREPLTAVPFCEKSKIFRVNPFTLRKTAKSVILHRKIVFAYEEFEKTLDRVVKTYQILQLGCKIWKNL